MPRQKSSVPTRQLYAQIREDLYLGAKARAAEMRVPLRTFLENALEMALNGDQPQASKPKRESVWNDEYLSMQGRQPVGSPVQLSADEASAILRESVGPYAR